MNEQEKLYNEELLYELKQFNKNIKRLNLNVEAPKINVEAPIVNVEPKVEITKNETTHIIDLSEVKIALRELSKTQKQANSSQGSLTTESKRQAKELKGIFNKIDKTLDELIKKETVVNVKASDVNIPTMFTTNPKQYIPVRLVDGEQFYNALSNLVTNSGRKKEPFEDYGIYATISDDLGFDYIGRENDDGKWVIEQRDILTGIFGYAVGKKDIATAWTGRASLEYNRLSEIK